MSVHIPSTLKVTELNVANTAEIQSLRFRDGGGGSWLLYAAADSTKLLYDSAVAASFELSEGSSEQFNLRVSGLVYGTGVHASFVKAERATIVGTLEADTLKANTLDVSNLDFSDTTLNVSSITVTGTAEINTLSSIQVLAEQGVIEQIAVTDTLDANRAVLSELTVLQTLHAGTINARTLTGIENLSANTITASFLDAGWIDAKSLTVNGVPIMGGGSSGGEGDSSGSMNLTINSLSATQYIEVAGSSADNNIRLSASSGLQLNTGASLAIRNLYDANVDPYVTIDTTGIKAPTIHGQTVKGGTISGGTVRGSTLHGASVQAVTAELESLTADVVQAISVRTDSWSLEGNQYTCSLTYSGGLTIPFVSCDITNPAQPVMYLPAQVSATEVSAETFDATDMTLQHSLSIFGASGASIFKLEKSAEEQASLSLTGNATIDGALSVESLTVNGVDITNNGSGSVEIPATIQVSVVEALNSNEAVTIPKLDSDSVTIDGTVDISATGRVNLNNAKFMADATGVSMLTATVADVLSVGNPGEDVTGELWLNGRKLTGYEGVLQLDELSVITSLHANIANIATANVGTLTVENLESSSSSGNIKIGALTVTSSGATIAGAFTANSINVPTGVLTARSVQLSGNLDASSVSITNDLTIGRTLRVGTAGLIISNDSISTPNLYANYIYATSIRDLDSLYTKDLYVNGVQITGNGDGTASGSGFSGQYTGGNVVLGSISNSNFYGFAQKDIITALGYNVYNPSSAEIPPFYDNTAAPAGIRIAPSEIVVGAQGGRLTLDAPSLQVYGGYGGSDIRVDTKDLRVADNESGSFMIRLHASSSYGPKLFIGEPDRVDGFRLSSLDIAAANMTLLGYQNSRMFALYSTSSVSSLTLKTASNNAALTLHSDKGLDVAINGTRLIYTDEYGKGVWLFGNKDARTDFYTNYGNITDGVAPQDVLNTFATTDNLHACLPLSLMLELFQLKSNLTLPPRSQS